MSINYEYIPNIQFIVGPEQLDETPIREATYKRLFAILNSQEIQDHVFMIDKIGYKNLNNDEFKQFRRTLKRNQKIDKKVFGLENIYDCGTVAMPEDLELTHFNPEFIFRAVRDNVPASHRSSNIGLYHINIKIIPFRQKVHSFLNDMVDLRFINAAQDAVTPERLKQLEALLDPTLVSISQKQVMYIFDKEDFLNHSKRGDLSANGRSIINTMYHNTIQATQTTIAANAGVPRAQANGIFYDTKTQRMDQTGETEFTVRGSPSFGDDEVTSFPGYIGSLVFGEVGCNARVKDTFYYTSLFLTGFEDGGILRNRTEFGGMSIMTIFNYDHLADAIVHELGHHLTNFPLPIVSMVNAGIRNVKTYLSDSDKDALAEIDARIIIDGYYNDWRNFRGTFLDNNFEGLDNHVSPVDSYAAAQFTPIYFISNTDPDEESGIDASLSPKIKNYFMNYFRTSAVVSFSFYEEMALRGATSNKTLEPNIGMCFEEAAALAVFEFDNITGATHDNPLYLMKPETQLYAVNQIKKTKMYFILQQILWCQYPDVFMTVQSFAKLEQSTDLVQEFDKGFNTATFGERNVFKVKVRELYETPYHDVLDQTTYTTNAEMEGLGTVEFLKRDALTAQYRGMSYEVKLPRRNDNNPKPDIAPAYSHVHDAVLDNLFLEILEGVIEIYNGAPILSAGTSNAIRTNSLVVSKDINILPSEERSKYLAGRSTYSHKIKSVLGGRLLRKRMAIKDQQGRETTELRTVIIRDCFDLNFETATITDDKMDKVTIP